MHLPIISPTEFPDQNSAPHAVLREARRLHRLATRGPISGALPVLRRLQSSQALRVASLPELFRTRGQVQRKHILRTLAVEAGYESWESYRQALNQMSIAQLPHLNLAQQGFGYLNIWFSSLEQAQAYTSKHGGCCLQVGQQAVVRTDDHACP
ncbi:MAG: hypothetical protein EPO09_05170 [Aquabacterium sp.]|uniref:hypothetical protein n=1 Tax=Aquabacterium sp. TaxID=1872578 RepID=UPI00121BEBA3|nr:hypothetical protein [Aquabacterium sp.]TAK96956.1 MAG: hypothetical protein EPO09_05170 [Aquabacterium sp.]